MICPKPWERTHSLAAHPGRFVVEPEPAYAFLSQTLAPIPLDKADAVMDAYCTQPVSVDFAACRALSGGVGVAMALRRD